VVVAVVLYRSVYSMVLEPAVIIEFRQVRVGEFYSKVFANFRGYTALDMCGYLIAARGLGVGVVLKEVDHPTAYRIAQRLQ